MHSKDKLGNCDFPMGEALRHGAAPKNMPVTQSLPLKADVPKLHFLAVAHGRRGATFHAITNRSPTWRR
jgi:hypothetical protein